MTIAELTGVTKCYGSVKALNRVDLSIESGELLALLGPNGAGKTTVVRLLLGLTTPGTGTVQVFGRNPRDASARSRTGAMLQIGSVPDTLRVHEHVRLFSSYYPKLLPLDKTVEAAGLDGFENKLFRNFSGGQKQRVLFALAICGDPDLLVLDEPTTALDVDSRRSMWKHIRSFVARGGSVLLTTHYLEEADALADRIVVIDSSEVRFAGTPAEIKSRSASKKIRCITTASIEVLQRLPGAVAVRKDGAAVEILTSEAELAVFELLIVDRSVRELEINGAGLEDAFLAITNRSRGAAQ